MERTKFFEEKLFRFLNDEVLNNCPPYYELEEQHKNRIRSLLKMVYNAGYVAGDNESRSRTTKRYIVELTKNFSEQLCTELKGLGINVIWSSDVMLDLIAVETTKTKDELEVCSYIRSAEEERIGTFNC